MYYLPRLRSLVPNRISDNECKCAKYYHYHNQDRYAEITRFQSLPFYSVIYGVICAVSERVEQGPLKLAHKLSLDSSLGSDTDFFR